MNGLYKEGSDISMDCLENIFLVKLRGLER